jgi:MYXO-CTERM domain-containing protein
MADAVFSLFAASLALTVTILASLKGAWPPAGAFAMLVVGFLLRARYSYRRHRG